MASSEIPNLGDEIEDAVATLCRNSFFPDFVVQGPKYRKAGGLEKEAADILVVFKGTALAIQVKTRIMPPTTAEEWPGVEEQRFLKVIEKGLGQFRALVEAINSPEGGRWESSRGTPLDLREGLPPRLFLILVYALKLPDGSEPEFKVRCSKSCSADGPIPIHIFSLTEFGTLLRMADTFPDFVDYLQLRGDLQEQKLISKTADPIDVWALFAFGADRVRTALQGNTLIETDRLHSECLSEVEKLEEVEKPSYLVDWLINELFAGSGRTLPVSDNIRSNATEEPGSLAAYQRVVPFLSQLNRRQRARLAEEFFIRIGRSQDGRDSFGSVKFKEHEEAYLFLCSMEPKKEWHVSLANLGLGLAHIINVPRVVCIATGPQGPLEDGCAAMIIERTDSKPSDKIIAEARRWFGPPKEESNER
ncbi:hypothetical protein [Actomonas aquatica]|uniref:DUF4365 domain-containing protein n=1 Tax=Actomonas aquatica TaxID=2866162 RepID=A0ABZ1C2C0_9BACT|nr:hypothetical protein [Opitutus sp. WL0086]WRQ85561.1 hypothetical protein K1X11_012180 [Opitutus sp. WL0086]